MKDFPTWQLHRGFWRQGVRENTMEAFRQAKEMGCSMVEMDVRCSKDGILHVIHDDNLKRFFHVDQNVSRTTSDDLSGLNIPTLMEVLESPDVPRYLNIEIKSRSLWGKGIAFKVLQNLKDYNMDKKILLSSFNPMVIYWVKKMASHVARALIVSDEKLLSSKLFEAYLWLAEPHFINAHYRLLDDEFTRELLEYFDVPLMVWTVNEHEKAKGYLTRGVKSVISDLPPRLSK